MNNIQAAIDAAMGEAQNVVTAELEGSPTLLQRIRDARMYKEVLNIRGLGDSIEGNQKDAYNINNLRVTGDKLFIRRDSYSCKIYPSHDTQYYFVENDVGKDIKQKHRNALRYWVDNQPRGQFYLADISSPAIFADTFGAVAVKLSELPPPPRKQSTGNAGGPRCSIKELRSSFRKMDSWTSAEAKDVDAATSIAVRRKGYNIVLCDKEMEPSIALKIAESLGYEHVYGLPASRYDKPRAQLKLKDLETEVKKVLLKLKLSGSVAEIASVQHDADEYSYEFDTEYLQKIDGLGEVCDNVVDFIQDRKPKIWRRLLPMFQIELGEVENPVQTFWAKYPLLKSIDSDITSTEIREYIKWKNLNS